MDGKKSGNDDNNILKWCHLADWASPRKKMLLCQVFKETNFFRQLFEAVVVQVEDGQAHQVLDLAGNPDQLVRSQDQPGANVIKLFSFSLTKREK
jgi:hypothetical protein